MHAEILDRVERLAGDRPSRVTRLGGGCVADVVRLDFAGRAPLVAKLGDVGSGLAVEGFMLEYLKAHSRLPVPGVVHADEGLLLMDFVPTAGGITAAAQAHAAELLADLHGITHERFGFERSTVIGGIEQPNPFSASWRAFFAEQRLLFMGRQAHASGRLPAALMGRVETLASRLERWIDDTAAPSLVHGDMWAGNILVHTDRIAGFVDPAIHYADAEVELAFATLFSTFSEPFFHRYAELRPLRPGFFEERRDLYNLYPLLVHVRLFGGSYTAQVDATLSRFGC